MNIARQSHLGLVLKKPSMFATLFFVLLHTGPPKFRFRDPEASLSGELDPAALIQVVVWILAGLWGSWQFFNDSTLGWRHFRSSYTLGGSVILCLIISIFVSLSPLLTAFKVFQVIVVVMFCYAFVYRYGIAAALDRLLVSNLILCAMIASAALVVPELIFFDSETGAQRLTGRGIAEAGIVGSFAIVLLFTTRRRIPRPIWWATLVVLAYFLFLTLMRTAYFVVIVFFLLAFFRHKRMTDTRGTIAFVLITLGIVVPIALSVDFSAYRDPESLYTLSDRIGLWTHYIERTLSQSPFFGFGFVSGPRILGLEYNPRLGSAHSIFFEVFVGAGLVGFLSFFLVFWKLSKAAISMLLKRHDQISFAISSLFVATAMHGVIGGELDSGQVGFTFWLLMICIPYWIQRSSQPQIPSITATQKNDELRK